MTISPRDALILTQVLRFDKVPVERKLELLERASNDGQAIGKYLLDPKAKISAPRRKLAEQFRGIVMG
jgi:hypothetical protein